MKRKLLSAALSATLCFSLLPATALAAPGMGNFGMANSYSPGQFTDVADGSWYAENVKTAYELGLMQGTSATVFDPEGNITIGSAIALAARIHSIYETGEGTFTQGTPWYQVYVDYTVANGIITAGQFSDYNANATRRQFAAILAGALPDTALEPVNTVDDGMIPDVPEGSAGYNAIYALYRAGILTGSDEAGTFAPETTIGRSSVAAIVSRMANPALRMSITLENTNADIKVTLNRTALDLNAGDSRQLTATVTPATSDETVTWTSSDRSVATVSSNGTVTAVAAGTATITAKVGEASARCTVTVEETYTIGYYGSPQKTIWYSGDASPYSSVNSLGNYTGYKMFSKSRERSFYVYVDGPGVPNVVWTSSDPSVLEIVRTKDWGAQHVGYGMQYYVWTLVHKVGTVTLRAEVVQNPSVYAEITIQVRDPDTSLTLDSSAELEWEYIINTTKDGHTYFDETRTFKVFDIEVEKLDPKPGDRGYNDDGDTYRLSYTLETNDPTGNYISVEYSMGSSEVTYSSTSERIDDGDPDTYTTRYSVMVIVDDGHFETFSFRWDHWSVGTSDDSPT